MSLHEDHALEEEDEGGLRQESQRLKRAVASLTVPPEEVFLAWDNHLRATMEDFPALKEWWDLQIILVVDVLVATNSLERLADRLNTRHGLQWKAKLFKPFDQALKDAWARSYLCVCVCVGVGGWVGVCVGVGVCVCVCV